MKLTEGERRFLAKIEQHVRERVSKRLRSEYIYRDPQKGGPEPSESVIEAAVNLEMEEAARKLVRFLDGID